MISIRSLEALEKDILDLFGAIQVLKERNLGGSTTEQFQGVKGRIQELLKVAENLEQTSKEMAF